MRCSDACSDDTYPFPESIGPWARDQCLGDRELQQLRCPRCGALSRPHVLWFDESYNETHYRSESALQALLAADWLLVIGTSGATFLPSLMGEIAARQGIPLINIDPEPSPFAAVAGSRGFHWRGPAAQLVPALVDWLEAQRGGESE
jgi:NAD-dependent deacetylase